MIRANILEDIHKQYVMYQLFKSLKFMHTAELLHRDVKARAVRCRTPPPRRCAAQRTLSPAWTDCAAQPSNMLLNSECQVKMADFGLARSVAQLARPPPAARRASPPLAPHSRGGGGGGGGVARSTRRTAARPS